MPDRSVSTSALRLLDSFLPVAEKDTAFRIDALRGRHFTLTPSGNTTLLRPVNGVTGHKCLIVRFQQTAAGSATLTLSGISGSTGISSTAAAISCFALIYNVPDDTWIAVPLGGGGAASSVALTVPSELSVSGSPVLGSGTLAVTWAAASGYKFIASPNDGSSGAYAGRAMVVADMPTGVKTRQFMWTHPAPAATTNFSSLRIPWTCTVTRLGSILGSGTCDFNIEYRTTIGSAGTNILSADQSSSTSLAETTSSFNQSALTGGNYLFVDYSAAASPVEHAVWLEVTCP